MTKTPQDKAERSQDEIDADMLGDEETAYSPAEIDEIKSAARAQGRAEALEEAAKMAEIGPHAAPYTEDRLFYGRSIAKDIRSIFQKAHKDYEQAAVATKAEGLAEAELDSE